MKRQKIQDKEIKDLFRKAKEQSGPNQRKVIKTFQYLQMEMDKEKYKAENEIRNEKRNKMQRKEAVISIWDILQRQFRLIDKTGIIIYILSVIISLCVMIFLHRAGIDKTGAIIVSMILSDLLSTFAVWLVNKLYFGKMAELGVSCYFDTRMCAAAGLVVTGTINFIMIVGLAIYSGNIWEMSLLQMGTYILTAYLTSSFVNFRILLIKTGEKASAAMMTGTLICSAFYIVVINIPDLLLAASIGIWTGVCVIAGILDVIQIRKLFSAKEILFTEAYHA